MAVIPSASVNCVSVLGGDLRSTERPLIKICNYGLFHIQMSLVSMGLYRAPQANPVHSYMKQTNGKLEDFLWILLFVFIILVLTPQFSDYCTEEKNSVLI